MTQKEALEQQARLAQAAMNQFVREEAQARDRARKAIGPRLSRAINEATAEEMRVCLYKILGYANGVIELGHYPSDAAWNIYGAMTDSLHPPAP